MNETLTRAQAVRLVNQLTALLPTLDSQKRQEYELFISKLQKVLMESEGNTFTISSYPI